MSLQAVPLLSFDFLPSRPVEIEVSPAPLTSDAGLVPIRQRDEQLRLTQQFAAALDDPRDPTLTKQSLLSMVRQRIYGILADYEDQNDQDTLRHDPVFKLVAGRSPGPPNAQTISWADRRLIWTSPAIFKQPGGSDFMTGLPRHRRSLLRLPRRTTSCPGPISPSAAPPGVIASPRPDN